MTDRASVIKESIDDSPGHSATAHTECWSSGSWFLLIQRIQWLQETCSLQHYLVWPHTHCDALWVQQCHCTTFEQLWVSTPWFSNLTAICTLSSHQWSSFKRCYRRGECIHMQSVGSIFSLRLILQVALWASFPSYKRDTFHEDQIGANVIRLIRLNQELSCGYIRLGSAPILDAKGNNPTISHILMHRLVRPEDRTSLPSIH